MSPHSAFSVTDFAEVQLRVPPMPDRCVFTAWLVDACATELDNEFQFVDDVEDDGADTCIYLYGTDPARLVAVACQVLAEYKGPAGIRAVIRRPADLELPSAA